MRSITTPALRLEPIRADHAETVYPDLADAAVYRYLDETAPRSADDLRSRFARWESMNQSEKSTLTWIFAPSTATPVGYVQARVIHSENSAAINYVLSARHRGHGYAMAAVEAVIDHLRIEKGINRYLATVHPQNSRAIRLLRRLAFVRHPSDDASACSPETGGKVLFSL